MSKAQNINPIFHRIYSSYFKTVRKIINTANKHLNKNSKGEKIVTSKDIKNIITDESMHSKYQELLDDNHSYNPNDRSEEIVITRYNEIHSKLYKLWHLFQKYESDKYITTLGNVTRPQTTLEKRWLRTISDDPRFKLFVSAEDDKKLCQTLQSYPPLYSADTIMFFDQFTDGDDYNNQLYQKNFQAVLTAIKSKRYLSFNYLANNDNCLHFVENIIPLHLEYSPKNDKFRLLAVTNGVYSIYNMNNIIDHCRHGSPIPTQALWDAHEIKPCKLTAVLEVYDSRNALQRALLAFSDYEKVVEYARKDNSSCICRRESSQQGTSSRKNKSLDVYKITLSYLSTDETELLIRILGMGHLVKVVESDSLISKIQKRLQNQAELLTASKANIQNKDITSQKAAAVI